MDVSKISQSTINNNIKKTKEWMDNSECGAKAKEQCKKGLFYSDNNQDGKTTGIDMYKDWSETCKFVFQGNDTFLKKGEEIATDIGEIYSRYAGDDGVLDEYEYDAALQSDEMGILLEQYWEMKNITEAQNGEEVVGLVWYDANYDEKVTATDVYKSKSNLYSNIFADNKENAAKAEEIAQQQSEILAKYAGEDGVLSSEEYSEAVQTSEYKQTLRAFFKLG